MAPEALIYKIALSMTKRVNAPLVHHIYDCGLTAEDFCRLPTPELSRALSLPRDRRFEQSDRDEALFAARREAEHMEAHGIKGFFLMLLRMPRCFSIN